MKRWKFVIAAVIALPVLAVAWIVARSYVAEARFRDKVEEYHKAGVRLTLGEMRPEETPEGENAAAFYDKAAAAWTQMDANSRAKLENLSRTRDKWTEKDVAEAKSLMAESAEALRLMREGAARTKSRAECDYSQAGTLAWTAPWFNSRHDLALMLGTFILAEAKSGDAAGAAECCRLLAALEASVAKEPWGTGLAWALASSGLATGVGRALDAGEIPEADLRALAAALGDPESREPVVRWAKSERAEGFGEICDEIYRVPTSGQFVMLSATPGDSSARTVYITRTSMRLDAVWFLNAMDRYVACAAKSPWEAKAQREALAREVKDLAKDPGAHYLSMMLCPGVATELDRIDESLARRTCAKTAILARLYRMKHGAYPDSLAALAPEFADKLPKDPFTGKDLVYRREGSGCIVYSLGPNALDDHGDRSDHDGGPDDIAFRLTR